MYAFGRPVAVALLAALAVLPTGPDAVRGQTVERHEVERYEIEVGDRTRSYLLVRPSGSERNPFPAVVFAFHGGGGHAEQFRESAGLDEVAEREGFLVVYPNGTGPTRNERLLTWNAGACCGYAQEESVDDVAFFLALLDDVGRRVTYDRRRVYLTGHSNGSMISYRIAAEAGNHVAAVVGVGGAMSGEFDDPVRPLPVLHIHSEDDPRALYEGGETRGLFGNRVSDHRPVNETLDYWIRANGCVTEGEEIASESWKGRLRDPRHRATLIDFTPCDPELRVQHWRLQTAGHGWPGDPDGGLPIWLIGPPTEVIDAAEEVWRFASRFTLPTALPEAEGHGESGRGG